MPIVSCTILKKQLTIKTISKPSFIYIFIFINISDFLIEDYIRHMTSPKLLGLTLVQGTTMGVKAFMEVVTGARIVRVSAHQPRNISNLKKNFGDK